jgi:hypothetical protein
MSTPKFKSSDRVQHYRLPHKVGNVEICEVWDEDDDGEETYEYLVMWDDLGVDDMDWIFEDELVAEFVDDPKSHIPEVWS